MENDSMIQVILGNFMLTVDKDTAFKLNDKVYAQQYLQQLLAMEHNQQITISDEDVPTSFSSKGGNTKTSGEPIFKNKVWTTSRTQTEADKEATKLFLDLRKKLNQKFSDKCTAKNSLWLEIAQNMNEVGFFVGEGVEGREKCRQKFVNLQISYIKYKDKKRSTGEGKIEKPPFYDEIDEILGDKDKANPAFLIDSLNTKRTSLQECSSSMAIRDKENTIPSTSKSDEYSLPSCSPSTSNSGNSESNILNSGSKTPTSTTNKFKKCVKTVTPNKNKILENFYNLAERAEQRQKMEFQSMIELMREESQKRHEQVMSLITALNKNQDKNNHNKKRKRDSSESD